MPELVWSGLSSVIECTSRELIEATMSCLVAVTFAEFKPRNPADLWSARLQSKSQSSPKIEGALLQDGSSHSWRRVIRQVFAVVPNGSLVSTCQNADTSTCCPSSLRHRTWKTEFAIE